MEKMLILTVVLTAISIGIFKIDLKQTKNVNQSDVTNFCNNEMVLTKETEFEIEEA